MEPIAVLEIHHRVHALLTRPGADGPQQEHGRPLEIVAELAFVCAELLNDLAIPAGCHRTPRFVITSHDQHISDAGKRTPEPNLAAKFDWRGTFPQRTPTVYSGGRRKRRPLATKATVGPGSDKIERHIMRRSLRILLVTTAASAIAVLGFAAAAQAHVTVDPSEAPQGGYAKLSFRVPDENDSASTTKIQVFLPTDEPVAEVLVEPVPGWTAQVATTKLANLITTDDGDQVTEAISQVTWTATSADSAIKPGQFEEFPISLGPLPKSGSMTFKTLQTYSDGNVVRWIDLSTPGQAEPEHPAPMVKLTAAGGASATSTSTSTPTITSQTASTPPTVSSSSNAVPLTISIIAAVIALAGLALAAMAYKRSRPTS